MDWLVSRGPVARVHSVFYDKPIEAQPTTQHSSSSDDSYVPVEWRHIAHQNAHAKLASQIAEASFVLSLCRSCGPLLLTNCVPKVVQLGSRDLIARPNDLAIRALKTHHTTVSRIRRMWVEPGVPDMKSNRLQILATWVTNPQT